jgi:hypothetical protein
MRAARKRSAGALIAALLTGGLLAGPAAAGPATAETATSGPDTPCTTSSPLYGVNYDYLGASDFQKVNVGPLLAELDPGTLRYPGGTQADYFNWHTGLATNGTNKYPFKLKVLKQAYDATGATPIFDLNVLKPANKRNTTDQVDMLKAAEADHIPVKYVELGNELYGGGLHGKLASAFPSGKAYGETVAAYVPVLHHDFPGVQVAADAVLQAAAGNTRDEHWNNQLLAAATGQDAPDALIIHDYPGLIYDPFTKDDVPPLFASAYAAIKQLAAKVASLGKPVWLTEYNYRGPYADKSEPNQVRTSYAHELYVAEMALMLPRIPRLAQADYFTALGSGPEFAAWDNPASPTLTPGGQAAAMIDAAACGATSSAPITVPGAPALPGGGAAATGQAFTGRGRATTALLINLSGSALKVPTGADVPDGAAYQRSPSMLPTVQQTAAIPLTSGTVSGKSLTLPRYSITLVNTSTSA